MSAWWLLLIVPASFYAGSVWSNWRWLNATRKKALTPDPYEQVTP